MDERQQRIKDTVEYLQETLDGKPGTDGLKTAVSKNTSWRKRSVYFLTGLAMAVISILLKIALT
jgi:hypothetical protein